MKQEKGVKWLFAKGASRIPALPTLSLLAWLIALVFAGASSSSSSSDLFLARVNQDELRIELTGGGFIPGEVQHAAGTFAIAVENSALNGAYTLRLKADDGTVLKEIEVQKGSAAWTVTLTSGEYTLTEASHPQWLCRITVH